VLQPRPNTFAQTILSLSFFACDKAADHTFRLVDNTPRVSYFAPSNHLSGQRGALVRLRDLSGSKLLRYAP
jgi:hypothetical protein